MLNNLNSPNYEETSAILAGAYTVFFLNPAKLWGFLGWQNKITDDLGLVCVYGCFFHFMLRFCNSDFR